MGLETLLRGWVSRALPQAQTDNQPNVVRLSRYGDAYVVGVIRKQHALADEGSYFAVNNNQSGLATAAAPTSFSATNPFILIYNKDSASNQGNKRIHLDYAMLLATAAGTAGANIQCAVTVDNGNRYTSGGTNLTSQIVNPNADVGYSSIAQVYAGNITASAATGSARTVVGNRFAKGAIPVVGDQYFLNFGSVEGGNMLSISTILFSLNTLPPLIIGPNQSALIHLWLPSQSAASSYAPELGWWER